MLYGVCGFKVKERQVSVAQSRFYLADALNKRGFEFEVVSDGIELIDNTHRIAACIKSRERAVEQLLSNADQNIRKGGCIDFVALINSEFILFFACPSADDLQSFNRMIVKESQENAMDCHNLYPRSNRYVYDLLGEPVLACSIEEINKISSKALASNPKRAMIDITLDNLSIVKQLLDKYEINVSKFLLFIFNSYSRYNSPIQIDDNGWIFDSKGIFPFSNDDTRKTSQRTLFGYRGDYIPIKDFFDTQVICSLLISHVQMEQLFHGLDRLERMEVRREHGRFFTTDFGGKTNANTLEKI